MLVIEQFHSEVARELYLKQYFESPIVFQEGLFSLLIGRKLMKDVNPKMIAIHFYAPIYFLIAHCDAEPEYEKEAFELLEKHIIQFNRIYRIGEIG